MLTRSNIRSWVKSFVEQYNNQDKIILLTKSFQSGDYNTREKKNLVKVVVQFRGQDFINTDDLEFALNHNFETVISGVQCEIILDSISENVIEQAFITTFIFTIEFHQ